jgi:hypothetical protein
MKTVTKQTITSEKTSINTLNKAYKLIKDKYPIASLIFDYGCGKYNTNKDFAEECGYEWQGYDPYNRTEDENIACIRRLGQYPMYPEAIMCNNVLNVLENSNIINNVLCDISHYAGKDTDIYITIYEGDKSGVGKVTNKGYQRNEKLIKYKDYINEWFDIIGKSGNVFICRKVV